MNDEVEHKLNLGDHAAVFCAALGGFVNLYATQALYPVLQSRYDASVADTGTLLTATTLGLAVAAPFAGRVAHRVGPRGAILAGMAALAGCTLLIAMAHAYAQLLLMRLAQGLMIPVVLSALLSGIGARWSGGAALALSATYVTGTVIGGLLGRFVPALLLPGLGWAGTFVCFSAAQALLLLPVWRLYRSVQLADAPQLPVRQWAAAIWPTLRDKLVGVSAAGFCLLFTQAAVTTYIAIRLASPPYAWGTAALGALYAVFLPALGFVRLTPRVMSALGAGRTLAAALALAWLGLLLTLASPAPAIVIGLTLFSVAVFIGQTVLAHLVGHAPTDNRELAAGIYLSCYYLGGSAGAWLPALLWPRFGWVGCIALTAAVQLAALALAAAGQRRWHTAC